MKNLKVKVISALVILSTIMPGAIANAQEVDAKKQQRIENSQAWKQEKASIQPKKDIIKQNHETNASLRETLKAKREAIKNLIGENKQNKKKLTPENKTALTQKKEELKNDISSLKAMKGENKNYWEAIKQDKTSKNYADIDKQLDNITAAQTARKTLLTKIGEKLDDLLTLLKKATN